MRLSIYLPNAKVFHLSGLRVSAALALIVVLPTAGTAHAAGFDIVSSGEAQCVILLPDNPSMPESFAAEQLRHYIQQMTGVTLTIQREASSGPSIEIGLTKGAAAQELPPASRFPQDDAFRIVSKEKALHLVGANPRGTVYAVYDLLERFGCRWFAPDFRFYRGLQEDVPLQDSLRIVETLDVTRQPAFKFRQEFCEHFYLHEPDDVVGLVDWCGKNRINTFTVRLNEFSSAWYRVLEPECARRGIMLTVEAHAFDRFLPRSRYFYRHPEWYGTVDGEASDNYFEQFQLTHPKALAEFKANLEQFVRDFPGLYSISAMPNDSPRWTDQDLELHTPVELLFLAYEAIAGTVYRANPNMKVSIGVGVEYFGQDGTSVWESPYPNVTWHTAVLRRTQKYPWNDPQNDLNYSQYKTAALVTKSVLAQGQDIVWSSRYAPFRDICLPGLIYPAQMAEELRDLHALGASGIDFNYAIPPAWIPYELKHYLFARMAWDVSADPMEILNTYYRERFSGSPDAMKTFYDNLRRVMERYEFPGGGYSREDAFGIYPAEYFGKALEDMDAAETALTQAFETNPDKGQQQIIWLLGASLQYAREKLEIDRLAQEGKMAEAAAKTEALMDYLEHWEDKGVVYDSSFLRMRLERRFLGPPRDRPIKKVPADNLRVYEFLDYNSTLPKSPQQPEAPFALPERENRQ